VEYYSAWASKEPAVAPKYRKIDGMGNVEDITARAQSALSA
jgi:adenylate kinase